MGTQTAAKETINVLNLADVEAQVAVRSAKVGEEIEIVREQLRATNRIHQCRDARAVVGGV